jgi:hypothetical protein
MAFTSATLRKASRDRDRAHDISAAESHPSKLAAREICCAVLDLGMSNLIRPWRLPSSLL